MCRPFKDFGRGYYLTSIQEQAENWALRTSRIFTGKPWVTVYEFDVTVLTTGSLNTKVFSKPNAEWAIFILNNRNREFSDYKNIKSNHDNKYDAISGPVANDDIALQMRLFTDGIIDVDTLVKGMEYRNLNDQYSFHTERAISHLKKMGAMKL
jgi:hypothetical protein